ncbi:MAG: 50S ribosomal protein L20 [bacterium]|nr:50S ribosomal protein L20 [bacterium]
MARVKRGTTANKRRKNVLAQTKGFRFNRNTKYRLAKDALSHAWRHAFRDRKRKKRVFRQLWLTQINAALREHNVSYSVFASALKKSGIELDRKILSVMAKNQPEAFKKVIQETGLIS